MRIGQASLSKGVGVVGLEISGDPEAVRSALDFVWAQGVSVESVELDVVE